MLPRFPQQGRAVQIVFVHQNFPAQFGHIANLLTNKFGYDCVFVSQQPSQGTSKIRRVKYDIKGGATEKNHFCSRTFENAIWHTHAVHDALAAQKDLKPDLIVGHSGFGSTLFLSQLFDCPVVNYFELFYRQKNSDMDFRPDFATGELEKMRAQARNAMILLDLNHCKAGYSPTKWQHSTLPAEYKPKVEVIFDGIDPELWQAGPEPNRKFGDWEIPAGAKIITYATRGMEAMRGFDIFMRVAKKLTELRDDIHVVVVGQDRVCYGGDQKHLGGKTLREHLFATEVFNFSRFHFLGMLPPPDLARLFRLSDANFYLTVPFVLSWSVFNALSCGAPMIASDTAPVREVITHGENGLLVDFFDVDGFVEQTLKLLDKPDDYRHLGRNGRALVEREYSYDVCLPRIHDLYKRTAGK